MELAGSSRAPFPHAKALGAPRPDEPVDVTLVLRRRGDVARFPAHGVYGEGSRWPRQYLSRSEFAGRHGAHPSDLAAVEGFAKAHGLEVGAVSVGARTVHLSGPLVAMEAAFGVKLQRWTYPGGSYRGRTGAIDLPTELAGVVVGVFGLDNRPQARPHFRRRKAAQSADPSYAPPTVAAAYDFPAGATGAGETIGLLELGGGYAPGDLSAFFSALGISVPSVTAVSVDGVANAPTGDPDGPDGEVELDIEVAGSVAPGAALVVYFGPNTEQGFVDALGAAVHDATHNPSVISISWGGPEESWSQQALDALNALCEDATTLGVTITAASGDSGASDGGGSGTLEVDFPASSPFVVGCGGTRLTLAGTTIDSETTWNDLSSDEGATGGGVSQVFTLPTYQSQATVPDSPQNTSGRGVPDVAADADPVTGYAVIVDGESAVLGGTSAVAPLWAGLVARMNQLLGSPLGFLNPMLYASGPAATFHPITTGSNGGYSAGPGWNPCTGLGSPDGASLLTAIRALPPPA